MFIFVLLINDMIKKIVIFIFLAFPAVVFAQQKVKANSSGQRPGSQLKNGAPASADDAKKDTIATIDMYKIVTLQKDTTLVDTSLSLKKEYRINYLRKDNFGLLSFNNEGHTYNTLDYGLTKFNPFPEFGFKAKHFAYLEVDDIKYYNVATPYTDLMYRSVLGQGQILDAFITANTSENFNLFVAYKGIRSIGKYINERSSNGNFRIGGSYNTTNKRYLIKFHFTGQDFSNQENGGITNTENFESGEAPYTQRERLDVYFKDATSAMKGNRFFADHTFRLNKTNPNSIVFHHQFNFENKFFEFTQPTVSERFGDTYSSSINNKTRYNRMYNLIGAAYSNEKIGTVEFYVDDYNYNYFYHRVIYEKNGADGSSKIAIPNSISDRINTYGARYTYQKGKWNGTALVSNSITDQSLANINLQAKYTFNEKNSISASYQNMNKLPDLNYRLYQSDYIEYNWSNKWKNEKINSLKADVKTQWVDASVQYTILNDHLYFADTAPVTQDTLVTVKPFQAGETINYLSLKVSKEFKFWKLGFDNTVLYQNVQQGSNILNVPSLVTRNTLYYTDHLFKKALLIQTGFIFQYFTKYNGNSYNPLMGEFYVQDKTKIGGYPLIDFFLNMKIQEFNLFLKAEHFNSSMSGYNYYSAPNYPYRDFAIRFGITWNFFS